MVFYLSRAHSFKGSGISPGIFCAGEHPTGVYLVNSSISVDIVLVLQQYWAGDADAYAIIGVSQLAQAFKDSGISPHHAEHAEVGDDLEAGRKNSRHTGTKGGKGSHQERQSGSNGLAGQEREGTDHMNGDTAYTAHQGMEDQHKQDLDPLVHSK